MREPTVIAPGGGEVIGDSPDRRVEILSDHAALHATRAPFGPRREGADLHVHRHHTDIFYVLGGELTVRLGPEGDRAVVPAGTLARVPPLVVHGFANESAADLRYLNFHAPGVGFADYLRALGDGRSLSYDQEPPPPDGGRPPTEAVIGGAKPLAEGTVMLAEFEALAIAEVRRDSGDSPHTGRHPGRDVSYYVLEGELALTAGDRDLRCGAGSWVQVPRGVEHTLSFPGSKPVRYLALHAPAP